MYHKKHAPFGGRKLLLRGFNSHTFKIKFNTLYVPISMLPLESGRESAANEK